MSESRSGYLAKNVGILAVSNFSSKILVFLLVPLYTSVLSTAEYGTYDLISSMVQLLFPLLTLNVTDAVMRFSMDQTKDINEVASIGIRYVLMSFVPVAVFLTGCGIGGWISGIRGYEGYIFLYFISYVMNQFMIQLAKGLEKVTDLGVCGIIGTLAMVGGNILFLLVFRWGMGGFLLANVLSQVGSAIYLIFRIRVWQYVTVVHIDKALRREMLVYSLPLIFTTLGWWVNNALDKYMVTFMCGVSANGLLSVSYKIPSILNVLQQIFIQAWQISAIKEYGETDTPEFYGRTFDFINVMMSGSAVILIILSRPIAHIMYAKDFYAAWQYVPFLMLASVLNCASGILGPILSAKKDSVTMARSAIAGSVVNFVYNLLLIHFIGVQGATIATAISSYVIYLVRKKTVRDDVIVNDYWKTYVNWVFVIVAAVMEIKYAGWIARTLLFVVMIFLDRQEIGILMIKLKGALATMKSKIFRKK